jgi:hypothetical protein
MPLVKKQPSKNIVWGSGDDFNIFGLWSQTSTILIIFTYFFFTVDLQNNISQKQETE